MSFRSTIDDSIVQEAQKNHARHRKYVSDHLHTFRVSLGGSTERKVPIKGMDEERAVSSTDGVKANLKCGGNSQPERFYKH